jgi:hypothetical protein
MKHLDTLSRPMDADAGKDLWDMSDAGSGPGGNG